MIEIEKFRKSMGKAATNLSNQQLEGLMNLQYKLANTLFDIWSRENRNTTHTKIAVRADIKTHERNGNLSIELNFGFIFTETHTYAR